MGYTNYEPTAQPILTVDPGPQVRTVWDSTGGRWDRECRHWRNAATGEGLFFYELAETRGPITADPPIGPTDDGAPAVES